MKFDHTNKWYINKPESNMENETHKIRWDFQIQTDHLILARRPDLVIVTKKENLLNSVDFAENTMEHESDGDTNCNRCSWYSHQRIGKRTRDENKWTSGDHPNNSIVEINQNTEKSPKDLRRLVVTQTPVKGHQLMLMWNTLKE